MMNNISYQKFSNVTVSEIADIIKKQDSFVLLSHRNPDCDTLGSTLALAEIIRSLEKKAICLSEKELPKYVAFLDKDREILTDCDLSDGDFVISVDVASPEMLGGLSEKFANRTDLRIDHHAQCTNFAPLYFNDPSAAATGEIIFSLARELGVMSTRIADLLFAAVVGDTGCFKFSNTSAETHRIAASLIDSGADFPGICQALFESKSKNEMLATGLASTNLEYYFDGIVSFIMITNELKAQYSLSEHDFESVSALTRTVEGVELGIYLKQLDGDGKTFKASLRSSGNIDSSVICASLGGGGHKYAAGATITADSTDTAKEIILSHAKKYLISVGALGGKDAK